MSDIDKLESRVKGSAMVEFAIVLVFLVSLLGGLAHIAIRIKSGMAVNNAIREAARVGADLPALSSNDARLQQVVRDMLAPFTEVSLVGISNTAPAQRLPITNVDGVPCALEFTVNIIYDVAISFYSYLPAGLSRAERKVTMRYNLQPLCS